MTRYIVVTRPNPHLPHDSEELQSPPPPDALTDEIAGRNAELMIGKLLGKLPAAEDADALAPMQCAVPAAAETAAVPAAVEAVTPDAGAESLARDAEQDAPQAMQATAQEQTCETPKRDRCDIDPAEARLRAALLEGTTLGEEENERDGILARLRPAHGAVAAMLLAAFFWPVLIGAVALLLIGTVIAATLLLRRAVAGGRWRRFARRHPRTAERMRRMADRAAVRVDRVLDLLPAGLADRLAWPDLSEPLSPGMG